MAKTPPNGAADAPPAADMTSTALVDPRVMKANETRVRRGFWRKIRRVAGRIPFAEDAAAAYYCAVDPETPFRVRATLFGALAYFVTPVDLIPDVITAFGFTDDATVLATAITIVSAHLKPRHRESARRALERPPATDENGGA